MLTVLTEYLDRGLTDYSAAQPGEDQAARLRQRLRERRTIGTAVGILMAQHDLSAADANQLLEQQAAEQRVAAHQVAQALVATTAGRADPGESAG